jgi:hypothetical protein
VPASPELVLAPAVIDMRESELKLYSVGAIGTAAAGASGVTTSEELFRYIIASLHLELSNAITGNEVLGKVDFKTAVAMLGVGIHVESSVGVGEDGGAWFENKFELWNRPLQDGGSGGSGDEITQDEFARFVKEEIDIAHVVAYNVSLSSQPKSPVTVAIRQQAGDQPTCHHYDHGVAISGVAPRLTFTADNYNVPQVVQIAIHRNFSIFQGTSRLSYIHTIESDDEDWKSPYLRPVPFTLVDDDECTEGGEKYTAFTPEGDEIRKCRCRSGYYILDTDPKLCDNEIRCGKCHEEMLCGVSQNLTAATVLQNSYRFTDLEEDLKICPTNGVCVGGETSGNALCADGHTGPFCMVCIRNDTHRFVWSGDSCAVCDTGKIVKLVSFVSLLGFFVFAAVANLVIVQKKKWTGKMKGHAKEELSGGTIIRSAGQQRVAKMSKKDLLCGKVPENVPETVPEERDCDLSSVVVANGGSNVAPLKMRGVHLVASPSPFLKVAAPKMRGVHMATTPSPLAAKLQMAALKARQGSTVSLLDTIRQAKLREKISNRTHSLFTHFAEHDDMEIFAAKAQSKYKIIVTFTQILSKFIPIYELSLPDEFLDFQRVMNPTSFMDVDFIPLNCMIPVNFHSKLVIVTAFPICFVALVGLVFVVKAGLLHRERMTDNSRAIQKLGAKATYLVVIFLISIFPLVTTVIFQTWSYDNSTNTRYLRADFSIKRLDPHHRKYIYYASAMCLLYCIFIPMFFLALIWRNYAQIQSFQQNEYMLIHCPPDKPTMKKQFQKWSDQLEEEHPMLRGLSPLFREYRAQYCWFEIPKLFCTLCLCGLVTIVSENAAYRTLVAGTVSGCLALAIAEFNPHLGAGDDKLSLWCQITLTGVLGVGLLMKAAPDEPQLFLGVVLIWAVTSCWLLGLGGIIKDFFTTFFPRKAKKLRYIRRRISISVHDHVQFPHAHANNETAGPHMFKQKSISKDLGLANKGKKMSLLLNKGKKKSIAKVQPQPLVVVPQMNLKLKGKESTGTKTKLKRGTSSVGKISLLHDSSSFFESGGFEDD